jgi:hypothetical protein
VPFFLSAPPTAIGQNTKRTPVKANWLAPVFVSILPPHSAPTGPARPAPVEAEVWQLRASPRHRTNARTDCSEIRLVRELHSVLAPVRHACRCLGYGVRSRFRVGVCGVVARLAENDSRPLSSPDPVRDAFRWLALRGQESFSWRGLRCGGAIARKRLPTPVLSRPRSPCISLVGSTGSGVVFVEGFAVWWRDCPKTTPDPRPLLTPFAMHVVAGQESFSWRGLRCGGAEDRGRESFSGGDSPTVKTLKRKRLPTPFRKTRQ